MSCNGKCNECKGHQKVHVDNEVSDFAKRVKISPKGNTQDVPPFIMELVEQIKKAKGIEDAEVKIIKVPVGGEMPEHIADALRYAMDDIESTEELSEGVRQEPKKVSVSRKENPIPVIIKECARVGMELVDIQMPQGSINHLLNSYPEYFEVDEDGDITVSKKMTDICMMVTSDDQLSKGAINIVDLGLIYSDGDIPHLVRHLMSAPAPTAGIKMSGLTLDAIVEVLDKEHDTKPLHVRNQLLIPCGGFMIVDVDNNMEYGVVKLTNRI